MTDQDKIDRILITITRNEEGVKRLEKKLDELEAKLDEDFVRRSSYEPVQKIVYGLVTVILMAFFTALVSMVISGGTW